MTTVLVLLDGWQVGCCGGGQRVGDVVSWELEVTDRRVPVDVGPPLAGVVVAPPDDPDWLWEAGLRALTATTPGAGYVRTEHFTAYGRDLPPAGTPLAVRAVLHEDHHDGIPETPPTTGTIRRIRSVDDGQLLAVSQGRTSAREDGSGEPRDVDEVVAGFATAGAAAPPRGPGSAGSPG